MMDFNAKSRMVFLPKEQDVGAESQI